MANEKNIKMSFEEFAETWTVEMVLTPLGGDFEIPVAAPAGLEKTAFDLLNRAKNLPIPLELINEISNKFEIGCGNDIKLKFTRRNCKTCRTYRR